MKLYDHLRHQERTGHPAARETARLLLRGMPEPERERDARDAGRDAERDAEVRARELASWWDRLVRR